MSKKYVNAVRTDMGLFAHAGGSKATWTDRKENRVLRGSLRAFASFSTSSGRLAASTARWSPVSYVAPSGSWSEISRTDLSDEAV
jgi:hypothetical protein